MDRSVISVNTETHYGYRRPNFLTQLALYSSALLTAFSRYAQHRFPTSLATNKKKKKLPLGLSTSHDEAMPIPNVRQNAMK